MSEQNPEPQEDIRVKSTGAIWGMSMGMLALSIPLSAVTQTAFIPVVVIAGASVATLGVWWRPGIKGGKPPTNKEQLNAQQRIAELEERLANLETINNFERRLAEETLKRQNAGQQISPGKVMPDEQSEIAVSSEPGERQRVGA